MWWQFLVENRDVYMMCTHGMSAQWAPGSASDNKHAGFFFCFNDLAYQSFPLSFVDPRHFGTIKFVFDRHEIGRKLKTLGFDPLQEDLDRSKVKDKINSKKSWAASPICELLNDQRIFAGVGNYIRAEALWRARVDPWMVASKLDIETVGRLCDEITNVMRESLASQGATIHTYATPTGDKGTFKMRVYGRDTDEDGNTVSTGKDSAGRTVHWAPARQR
jgi:DNA-formamidopyrimidine glycosylase